jgi:2-C-methyl-D-erythritol 2,4-cyclodiphosphate synthase
MDTPRSDHFTEEARAAISRGAELAEERGARRVSPEHVLLALLEDVWTAGHRALDRQGVDVRALARALDAAIKRRPKRSGPSIGPALDQVLRVAMGEARRHGVGFVGTEHLLVGLLSIRDGMACAFLEEAGARLDPALEYSRSRRARGRRAAEGAASVAAPPPRPSPARVGIGYDTHEIRTGQSLVLGGVEIPSEFGLVGHSDADVLCHAIMDALLGAAALGDIGQVFPDDDARYRGASSVGLLTEVARRLGGAGWSATNVDAVVVAQAPKIAPHTDAMRNNIAEALGIEPDRVAVKGTTTEGLGPEGEGLGMSAQAVVMIGPAGS